MAGRGWSWGPESMANRRRVATKNSNPCTRHTPRSSGCLYRRILVDPSPLDRGYTLLDAGPHAEIGGEQDDPRRLIALVGVDRARPSLHLPARRSRPQSLRQSPAGGHLLAARRRGRSHRGQSAGSQSLRHGTARCLRARPRGPGRRDVIEPWPEAARSWTASPRPRASHPRRNGAGPDASADADRATEDGP